MNIIVRTYSGKNIVRPDTTWERDNEDVFLPEFVEKVSYVPVLFARISKPGRSVALRFADRYYDGIGYGVLLYPENLVDGSEEGYSCASCLDHTSFLPFPLYNKVTLGREGNSFELALDGETLFSYNRGENGMICSAIEDATRFIYIRTGDIIAIELAPRAALCERGNAPTRLSGTYCGNETIDFRIIL